MSPSSVWAEEKETQAMRTQGKTFLLLEVVTHGEEVFLVATQGPKAK